MGKKGFTLIEIMLVVALIGVMSAIVLPRLSGTSNNQNKKKEVELFKESLTYVCNSRGTITLFDHFDTFVDEVSMGGEYDGWAVNMDEDEIDAATNLNDSNVSNDKERKFETDVECTVSGITGTRRMLLILSAEDGILKAYYGDESSIAPATCQNSISIIFNAGGTDFAKVYIDKYTLRVTSEYL